MHVLPLPYHADSSHLFSFIRHLPWSIFLDSGEHNAGRYDLFTAAPCCTLSSSLTDTVISQQGQERRSVEDPFTLLQQVLAEYNFKSSTEFPFCGGAMGYFSYDLGRRLEKLPTIAHNAEQLPLMQIGLYDWVVVVDHQKQCSHFISQTNSDTHQQYYQWLQQGEENKEKLEKCLPFILTQPLRSNLTKTAYSQAIDQIKAYLRAGDCYQINFAQRFSSPAKGDPWEAYQRLRQQSPAPYGAYLQFPDVQILSNSPEQFLAIDETQQVSTKPIKGTRPRHTDIKADQAAATALLNSPKDWAENIMIVDLLRNDISKTCKTVRVPKLCALESFATVHHLVSTVTGQLTPHYHNTDVLRSCFPGGSITGAPKIRAMEIIDSLEPQQRGIYCGSIGYLGSDGRMDTNICIRTLVYSQGVARFWAGGGIVYDSDTTEEYQETFDKAKAFMTLFSATEGTS